MAASCPAASGLWEGAVEAVRWEVTGQFRHAPWWEVLGPGPAPDWLCAGGQYSSA